MSTRFIKLVSIDIGKINFAQRVEEFSADTILDLEKRYSALPKSKQRRVKGPMCTEIEEILTEVAISGKRIQTGVYSFLEDDRENGKWTDQGRLNLLAHLKKYTYLWDECDIFVIEQQFFNTDSFPKRRKGKKNNLTSSSAPSGANVDAIKIGEATYMWFLERYPHKTVTYFGSQFKTQIYGAPVGLSKPERKRWATAKSREFEILRQDQDMINIHELSEAVKFKRIKTPARIREFKNKYPCVTQDAEELSTKVIVEKQKLDDSSDTDLQAQAFKYRTMVACF